MRTWRRGRNPEKGDREGLEKRKTGQPGTHGNSERKRDRMRWEREEEGREMERAKKYRERGSRLESSSPLSYVLPWHR